MDKFYLNSTKNYIS